MVDRISEEITFRKLEVLLAYLQAGNLARAAELLDVSAVSVHRPLHSLEEGVRCQLFRHEGRNLIPTDAAQLLACSTHGSGYRSASALQLRTDLLEATVSRAPTRFNQPGRDFVTLAVTDGRAGAFRS